MTVTGSQPDESWRRLSARMLLVHPVRELARYIPALVGLVVAGHSVGNGELWWLGPLGVVAVIALSVLRWATTRYRITPEAGAAAHRPAATQNRCYSSGSGSQR